MPSQEQVVDSLANQVDTDLSSRTTWDNGTLTRLDLSNIGLSELPSNLVALLQELPNITSLSLSQNQIQTLPCDIFSSLSKLQRLFLYENQLQELPEKLFYSLSNLRELYLNANQLAELPVDIFEGLVSLRSLVLYHNPIEQLPAAIFEGLGQLTTLDLSYLPLTTLPVSVGALANLQTLNLTGTSLDPELTRNWRNMGTETNQLQQVLTPIREEWQMILQSGQDPELVQQRVDDAIDELLASFTSKNHKKID